MTQERHWVMRALTLGGLLWLGMAAVSLGETRPGAPATDIDRIGVTSFSLARYAPDPSPPPTGLVIPEPDGKTVPAATASAAQTAEKPKTGPKRPWRAAGDVILLNFVVWGIDYQLSDKDYAYVSPNTMMYGLSRWFEWDRDFFRGNFFAHPYHGSLYFNSGRANGLDFWGSALCSFGGSLTWETLFERERPSYNDIVNTSVGGAFLGEVLYRFSSLILNDKATGSSRKWKEILATVIDPMRGFNRLVDGEWSGPTESVSHIYAPVTGLFQFSGGLTAKNASLSNNKTNPVFALQLDYGDAYKDDAERKPFDYFAFDMSFRYSDPKMYPVIYGNALLVGKNLKSEEDNKVVVGLFQNYDYFNNESFELGGSSVVGGIRSTHRISEKFELTTMAQLGWLLVGASSNEYVDIELRDYNFGSGITAKLYLLADFANYGNVQLQWGHFTIFGISGVMGTDNLNLFQARYVLPVWRGWGLGLSYNHYRRNSHYKENPDVNKFLYEFRTSVTYAF
jgi:Domain of unknown function (DUF3943)